MGGYQDLLRKRTENFRQGPPMYSGAKDNPLLRAFRGLLGLEEPEPFDLGLRQIDPSEIEEARQARDLEEEPLGAQEDIEEPPEYPTAGYPTRERREEPIAMEREIQEALVTRGAQIEVDGYAGPETLGAVNEQFTTELKPGDMIPGWILNELGVSW